MEIAKDSPRAIAFKGQVTLSGVIECASGLHVGGNRDALSLSAVELPVARDPATRLPIVPGSSLKGKLRALLEMLRGKVRFERGQVDGRGDAGSPDSPDSIDLLFGAPSARRLFGPTRLVVRDGFPLDKDGHRESTAAFWQSLETDSIGTEVKSEAAINRVTAAAQPRQVERVVAGSRFSLDLSIAFFDYRPDEEELLKDTLVALSLLEDSYLGGHGSRGYGRVRILLREHPSIASAKDYEAGRRIRPPGGDLKPLSDIDKDAWVAQVRTAIGAERS